MKKSVNPPDLRGHIDTVLKANAPWRYWYPWLEELAGTDTFVHVGSDHVGKDWPPDPDPGYSTYVLAGDAGMPGWGEHVASMHQSPVYVVSLPEVYNPSWHDLVTYIPNTYYHQQIELLRNQNITKPHAKHSARYKASAMSRRLSQSKCIILAALQQIMPNDCLVSWGDQLHLDDVHHWNPTNDPMLDDLTEWFQKNCLGGSRLIPGDDQDSMTMRHPAYESCAFNFTNESFHYSFMYDQSRNRQEVIPGPFMTEKTFKCLLSFTAFIPVGQFRSYRWLESMGMEFDYGLDLSFDDDPGNITRLRKTIDLIQTISQYSVDDLNEMTKDSNSHNYAMIESGEFFQRCEKYNQQPMADMLNRILG